MTMGMTSLNLNLNLKFEFELPRHWLISELIMKPLFVVIMRGLPGNGKTTLSKMLQWMGQKKGMMVARVSKDMLRNKIKGYQFNQNAEMATLEHYHERFLRWAMDPNVDMVISDNTNLRKEELEWHWMIDYPREVKKIIIQIGNAASDIRETIPVEVQARMRNNMIESEDFIDAVLLHDMGTFVQVEPKSAVENGINELFNELIY